MVQPEIVPLVEDRVKLTPSSRCFFDHEMYDMEIGAIFHAGWQPAGHADDVREPGDYLTTRVAGEEITVIRGRDGVLRAFFNVCRHRGHRLLAGKGRPKVAITCPYHACPYHACAYGLDGALRSAPHATEVPGLDPGRVALHPVAVEDVGKMIQVNVVSNAPAYDRLFPGVRGELADFVPGLDELRFHRRSKAVVACNWTVAVENYGECCHCRHAHPILTTALLNREGFVFENLERHQRQRTSGHRGGVTLCRVDAEAGPRASDLASWLVWPNVAFQVNPGSNLVVFQFHPDGPERTFAHIDWFFGPWVEEDERDRIVEDHARTTLQEDIVENVQIGLESKAYDRGVPMVNRPTSPFSEHLTAHWQDLRRSAMGVHGEY